MNLNELCALLKSAASVEDIDKRRDAIANLIPKVSSMFGYDQQNRAHEYDLWFHSLHTVINLPRDLEDDMLYLAALLHDIGKPDCRTEGEYEGRVNCHYYGHPKRSMETVRDEIIPTLNQKDMTQVGETQIREEDKRRLLYYVECHDDYVSLRPRDLKVHLERASLKEFKNLMLLEVADAKAHVLIPAVAKRVRICEILAGTYVDKLYERGEEDTCETHNGGTVGSISAH